MWNIFLAHFYQGFAPLFFRECRRVIGTALLDIGAVPLDPHFDFLLNSSVGKVGITSTVAKHEIAKFIGAAINSCDKMFNASAPIFYRASA